jgi:uncharacterized protein (DUF433 family)
MPLPHTGTGPRRGLVWVRCVDHTEYEDHLTPGQDYELLAWEDGLVRVIDNDGVGYLYDPARFAELLDDGTVGLRLEYPSGFFTALPADVPRTPRQVASAAPRDEHDCAREHPDLLHWLTIEPVVTAQRSHAGGAPCIRGTTMQVAALVDLVAAALFARSYDDLKHDLRIHYDLTLDDAAACARYAADTVRSLRRAPDFLRGYYTKEQATAELNQRVRSLDDGRETTVPWEEVKARLAERFLDAEEHLPDEPPAWRITTSGKFVCDDEPLDVIGKALYWEDIAAQFRRYVQRLAPAAGAAIDDAPDTIIERAIARLRSTP